MYESILGFLVVIIAALATLCMFIVTILLAYVTGRILFDAIRGTTKDRQ